MRPSLIPPLFVLFFATITCRAYGVEVLTPVIDGDWWQVAGNPDLGGYTTAKQQPVDFGVWQAADGTWQLWSCIRHTDCGGKTRLFYRWEGHNLTDNDWTPIGIAMEARPDLGETAGGLQAPHVVRHEGLYYMAYGDWVNICFATSRDGKNFERLIQPNGKCAVFSEGPGCNTRDPMLINIDGLWHCYFTAFPHGRGYGYCRTSPDLKTWSHSCVVSYGGSVGSGACHNECPHVAQPEPGLFFYFRNQYYGEGARNWVYCSDNPLNFGIDDDTKLVRRWRLAAPEILVDEGQYYVAALRDSLDGIKIARLKWVRLPEFGEPVFDFNSEPAAARHGWRLKQGNLPTVFTTSTHSYFNVKTKQFICTAALGDDTFSDAPTGVVESPVFRLSRKGYIVLVSGGNDAERLYVAVIDAETGSELAHVTGRDTNDLSKYRIDCSHSQGSEVFVRIVDESSDSWGHINFGGLYVDPLSGYDG